MVSGHGPHASLVINQWFCGVNSLRLLERLDFIPASSAYALPYRHSVMLIAREVSFLYW